jgi:hypothetical protein
MSNFNEHFWIASFDGAGEWNHTYQVEDAVSYTAEDAQNWLNALKQCERDIIWSIERLPPYTGGQERFVIKGSRVAPITFVA